MLVEVLRAGVVESVHRGHVVVVDEAGEVVAALGDPRAVMYPRSAVKPLQALGMLRCGLDIDGRWLALASASHSGESFHRQTVVEMLGSVGLTVDDLRCPSDWPYGLDAEREYVAAGGQAARVAMNCSGKHAAMLMTCVARDWPIETYLGPEHPLQVQLRATVEELAGPVQMASTDGCGAPLWGLRLDDLARSFVRISDTPVAAVMRGFPEYVGGTTRDVTRAMREVPTLVAKDGAEAVQAMTVMVDGRRYGIALKIVDGADRARAVAAAGVLNDLGLAASGAEVPVLGGGRPVGEMRWVQELQV